MQFPFKRKKSEIVRKAKEERIVYEAMYKLFADGSIKDDMITIGRIYHDGDDFETSATIDPFKIVFRIAYDANADKTSVVAYKQVEV